MTQLILAGVDFDLKTPRGLTTPRAFVLAVLEDDDLRRRFGVEDYASKYSEPGYQDPREAILFGNWNDRDGSKDRKRFGNLAEYAGFELEWSDEWSTCCDCGNAVRTSPDSYGWQRSYTDHDCEIVCVECLTDDPAGHLARLEDDPEVCNTIDRINPNAHGYVRYNGVFESGFHPGQTDNPREIFKRMQSEGLTRIVFNLESVGQFDARFTAWHAAEDDDSAEDTDSAETLEA